MTQLSTSAAYIRKDAIADPSASQTAGLRHLVVDEQVWELLETPQTVESLHRAASRETQADRLYIEETLERLLDADLIELSADS